MCRFRVGSFAIAGVLASSLACGGRARSDGLGDAPSVSAGTGDADDVGAAGSRAGTSAGGSTHTLGGAGAAIAGSGAGGAERESDLDNSCPQAANDRSCSATEIDIRFTREAVDPRTEIWVEPFQIPAYAHDFPANSPEVEPSKWDRSATSTSLASESSARSGGRESRPAQPVSGPARRPKGARRPYRAVHRRGNTSV